jgi:adenylate cyclase
MNAPRNLCLLFADVAGSTRLYERIGDTEALRAVERCLSILKRVTESYQGRVIKTIGDEIMSALPSAESGLQAASEMQQRINDLPALDGIKLAIRIGFHYGPVVEVDGDVFGDTVNTAARMSSLARGGQIFTTQSTVAALPELLRMATRDLDALSVKGKAEDVNVFEVIWQENSDLTMKASGLPHTPFASRLQLRYRELEVILDVTSAPLVMGRDATCGLVIRDPRASRQHVRIERQRDKFVLYDQSTNGTYVRVGSMAEAVLRHEMMPLHGTGTIAFGHPVAEAGIDALEFALLS